MFGKNLKFCMFHRIKIKKFIFVLALCIISVNNSWSKEWIANPSNVIEVRWNKNIIGESFKDSDGVCNVFSNDDEESLTTIWSQIENCKPSSKSVTKTKTIKVQLYKVDSLRIVNRYKIDIYGMERLPDFQPMFCLDSPSGKFIDQQCGRYSGFYFQKNDFCGIVLHSRIETIFGHELKHCYDGRFHNVNGEWK